MLLALRTLALAFWFGAGLGTMFATQSVFRAVQDRRQAGDLAGAILRAASWGRAGWAVPFLISALAPRGASFTFGVIAFFFAAVQLAVDAQTRVLRARLAEDESLRARFGALHGVSVLLLMLHVLAAGIALVAIPIAPVPQ